MLNRMDQSELAEWVAGFYDGEGCVEAYVRPRESQNVGYHINPETRIAQTYVGGLFDGEGLVILKVQEKPNYQIGYGTTAAAGIGQTPSDRLFQVLDRFADQIGINYNIQYYERDDENHDDLVHWGIYSRDHVERFLREIRPYTVIKRPQIDVMLEEIIPRLKCGFGSNRRQFLEIIAWRDVMDSTKGGIRGKYNLDYFEDLWGIELEPEKVPEAHPRNRGRLDAEPGGVRE